jgi:6-phosphofructokinase 1
MLVNGEIRDMTATIAANYLHHRLDALVCIGGGGTQKNALRLAEAGLNIITLPKTIDNDIALTDTSIGFDTATAIATETIDRLHSTAHSHHRIIVLEVMGHRAGWLALAAGFAGGADVILIPEMPYSEEAVAAAIRQRSSFGLPFSIVAVAEGSVSARESKVLAAAVARKRRAMDESARERASLALARLNARHVGHTWQLSRKLEALTGLEARITILGYVQRGGSPTAADRLLATQLGTRCIESLEAGHSGVMVAVQGDSMVPVPLRDVAGTVKLVPPDHPWLASARRVGTCLGA